MDSEYKGWVGGWEGVKVEVLGVVGVGGKLKAG